MRIILNKEFQLAVRDYVKKIHSLGYRLTPQRRLVMEILEESQEHIDAEWLFIQAKRRDPNISLATVYRSLALLKEAGLVQEHHLGEDHGHFETAGAGPHYHFTCLKCGRVIEFEAPQVKTMVDVLGESKDLQVTQIQLHLSGYCSNCRPGKGNEKRD